MNFVSTVFPDATVTVAVRVETLPVPAVEGITLIFVRTVFPVVSGSSVTVCLPADTLTDWHTPLACTPTEAPPSTLK